MSILSRSLKFSAINEENLFELVLPLPTIIGHVLLRFSLNHSILHASPPPQIRVTLLRQKPSSKPGQRHELDEHIDFGLTHENKRDGSFSKDQYIENLEKRYKAKVILLEYYYLQAYRAIKYFNILQKHCLSSHNL